MASLANAVAVIVAVLALSYVAVLIYRRPQRGLLFLAAATPLHGLLALAPVGGWASGWKEALLALTAVCAWLRRRPSDPLRPPVHLPWWPAAAIFAGFGTVSALVVFGPIGVVAVKVTYLFMSIVAVLWLAPFDARDRDNLVSIVMFMGAFTSIAGIAQQLAGPSVLAELGYHYGQQLRTTGGMFRTFSTFNQPFPFALYVMLALLVGGAVALAEPRRRRNLVFLCLTPLMVFAMLTSVVRASILGLMVGITVLILVRFRAGIIPAVAAVVGVVACLPFLPGGVSKVLFSSSSLDARGAGWSEFLKSAFVNPLGQGLGSTGSAADRMALAGGMRATLTSPNYQPDNYYVKIFLELGPIGLWALVMLLITALVWTVRLSRTLPGRDGALSLGVSASVAAAMAASTVATYFEIFPLDVYFWLLLGVVGCAAAQNASDSGRSPSGQAAAASRHTSVNS